MKQHLLLLTFLLIASLSAKAQIRFAPEISMKQTYINYNYNAEMTYVPFGSTLIYSNDEWRPHIGINVSYPLLKKYVHLSSGIFWNPAQSTNIWLVPTTAYKYSWINLQQLSIPLNVTLKLPMKRNELFLSVGPYLTSFLSAKVNTINRGFGQQYKIEKNKPLPIGRFDEGANVKGMDVGANINIGFGHRNGMQFKVSYHNSFVDPITLPSEGTVVYQRNAVTFSIAYQF